LPYRDGQINRAANINIRCCLDRQLNYHQGPVCTHSSISPGCGAVVIGGNGGIGCGMARALLSAGASVAVWCSNLGKTERAEAKLAAESGDASRCILLPAMSA
jgi:hypothetical protein